MEPTNTKELQNIINKHLNKLRNGEETPNFEDYPITAWESTAKIQTYQISLFDH